MGGEGGEGEREIEEDPINSRSLYRGLFLYLRSGHVTGCPVRVQTPDLIDSRRSIARNRRFINRSLAISSSMQRRRRAASLLLLATIEAGFNSYSLNSNSVGQDAGVTSRADLAAIFKGLISRRALSLRRSSARFLRRLRCRAIERPVDMSAGERFEIDRLLSSTNRFLLWYFCHGSACGLFWTRASRKCQRPRAS